MINNEFIKKLKLLHNDGGKHSNYQNYPKFVTEKIGIEAEIDENWRGDSARFEFLNNNIYFGDNFKIVDIGANTGKFCLDLAYSHNNCNFYAYELNNNYVQYINLIKEEFHLDNIKADTISVGIEEIQNIPFFDIIFHMNVLHHAGVDFDNVEMKNYNGFADYSREYLKRLSSKCNTLIFQMGYNQGGDKSNPIVKYNNISEMIKLELNIFKCSNFQIVKMALYNEKSKKYVIIDKIYDIDEYSNNKCSEFYKRPIFILSSIQKEM